MVNFEKKILKIKNKLLKFAISFIFLYLTYNNIATSYVILTADNNSP